MKLTISSEKELVDTFGKPDGNTYEYFYTNSNFLQYSNTLKVVRVTTGNVNACVSGTTAIQIKNTQHYLDNYASGQANVGSWEMLVLFHGTHGNNLKVSMCTNSSAFSSTATSLVNNGSGIRCCCYYGQC